MVPAVPNFNKFEFLEHYDIETGYEIICSYTERRRGNQHMVSAMPNFIKFEFLAQQGVDIGSDTNISD